jgi:hypothetical protein
MLRHFTLLQCAHTVQMLHHVHPHSRYIITSEPSRQMLPSLLQVDTTFLLMHCQLLQVLTGDGTLRPLEA